MRCMGLGLVYSPLTGDTVYEVAIFGHLCCRVLEPQQWSWANLYVGFCFCGTVKNSNLHKAEDRPSFPDHRCCLEGGLPNRRRSGNAGLATVPREEVDFCHEELYKVQERVRQEIREEIFSSSFAAAGYLTSVGFPSDKKVYVIGEIGITSELEQAGIQHLGGPEDSEKQIDVRASKELDFDPNVGAVVVGFDRHINYYKLVYATLCLRGNPGCLFIATNLDSVSNMNKTQEWPAGGCMVGAVKTSTFLEPTEVGKPSTFMVDYLANKSKLETRKCSWWGTGSTLTFSYVRGLVVGRCWSCQE